MFKAAYSHIVYFSPSSKCIFFWFEVNFTIFPEILSEQERVIIAFKKSVFNKDISIL